MVLPRPYRLLRRLNPRRPGLDFSALAPVGDDYALRPIATALTWDTVAPTVAPGEWYLVVFRSIRLAEADEAELFRLDEAAHLEAATAPGFIFYFKGPLGPGRECLSFCIWTDQAAAREAAGRPAHLAARAVTARSYASYALELHRLTRPVDAAGFVFEAYEGH